MSKTAAQLYQEILGRSPENSRVAAEWQNNIDTVGWNQSAAWMRMSPEYQGRANQPSSSLQHMSIPGGSSFLSGLSAANEKIQKESWDIFKDVQLPYEKDYVGFQRALLPAQYGLAQITLDNAAQLAPLQHQYDMDTLQSKSTLLPYVTAYGVEKLESDRELLPYLTQTKIGQTQAIDQLREEAAKGIDIERRVGQAGADAQAIGDAQKAASQRDLTRMGINPASGRYAGMQRDAEISTAGNKLGAMNQARWNADTENWNRRTSVAQGFGL